MSAISAKDVMKLRSSTGAPMMDCKGALAKAEGDFDKAVQILRESNAAIQAKKGARETAEGRIAIYIDMTQNTAAILELRCESAPVAKSEEFVELANQLGKHICETPTLPDSIDELLNQPIVGSPEQKVNDRIAEVVGLIRENMKPARFARVTGGVFGSYVHFDGSVGVLLQVEGDPKGDVQILKDVCMHIAARQPGAGTREDLDPAEVAKELEMAKSQAASTGKPDNIVEKIAEGKMKTWYAENVLLEQPFVKEPSRTVGDLLKSGGFTFKQFIRYKVGELS